MTILRHNRVSTKNGWKSVLLGTLTKSKKPVLVKRQCISMHTLANVGDFL